MTTLDRLEFGYFPRPLTLKSGPITVCPLADLAITIANVEGSQQVEQDWIYAGPQLMHDIRGGVRKLPSPPEFSDYRRHTRLCTPRAKAKTISHFIYGLYLSSLACD